MFVLRKLVALSGTVALIVGVRSEVVECPEDWPKPCRQADRQERVRLARDLEEAGYVDVYAITYQGLRASYSATEEGRRRLQES